MRASLQCVPPLGPQPSHGLMQMVYAWYAWFQVGAIEAQHALPDTGQTGMATLTRLKNQQQTAT